MDYKYTKEYFQIFTKIQQELGQIQLFLGLFREDGRKSGKKASLRMCLYPCLYDAYLDPQTDVLTKREWKEVESASNMGNLEFSEGLGSHKWSSMW